MPIERRVALPWIPLLIFFGFVGSLVGAGLWATSSERRTATSDGTELEGADAPPETAPEDDSPESGAEPPPTPIEATLSVRVTDAAGQPAAGAKVRVLRPFLYRTPRGWLPLAEAPAPEEAATGEDGAATLRSSSPYWGIHVFVQSEGTAGAPAGRAVYQTVEDASPVDVALAPAQGIEVRLTDLAGRPLEEAVVHVVVPLADDSRVSASGDYGLVLRAAAPEPGSYGFPPLPIAPDLRLHLCVERPGYRTERIEIPAGESTAQPVTLQLVRSITARGRLVQPDGTPLRGARVTLAPASRLPDAPVARVLTDDDGAFELAHVPETGGMLQVDTGYLTPTEIPFPEASPDAESLELGDLAVVAAGRISGVVLDGQGEAVRDAIVFISPRDSQGSRSRGRTDVDGAFSLAALGPGEHRVFATEGHVPPHWEARSGVIEGVKPGSEPVEIRLIAVRLLRIEIDFRSGDAPTGTDWTVGIHALPAGAKRDGSETPHLYRGVRSVRFTCPRVGPHVISVEIPGFVVGTGKAEVVADGEAVVNITMRRETRE